MNSLYESIVDLEDDDVVKARYLKIFPFFELTKNNKQTPSIRTSDNKIDLAYLSKVYNPTNNTLEFDNLEFYIDDSFIDLLNKYNGCKIKIYDSLHIVGSYSSNTIIDVDNIYWRNILDDKSSTKKVLFHNCKFSKKTIDILPDKSLITIDTDVVYDKTDFLTNKGNHRFHFSLPAAQKYLRAISGNTNIFIK